LNPRITIISLFTIIAALCSDYCFAQSPSLQNWIGTYEGNMQVYGRGKLQTELPVDLVIANIPGSNRLTWKMTYYEPYGILVKDYQMILPLDQSNLFVLDEMDGTTLNCYAYDNTLTSCFTIEGFTICDIYIKSGNSILMELFGGKYKHDESTEIQNMDIQFLQRVNLKKMN
jgi:hypothetical protein